VNNIFTGNGSVISTGKTAAKDTKNLKTDPGLVDSAGYDYHLISSATTAINAGIDPGMSDDGYDLTPVYQYVNNAKTEVRAHDGAIDIGAYEYK